MSKWIRFVESSSVSRPGKTKTWDVRTEKEGQFIGKIGWYSAWRKYVYYPENSLYEEDCLRDIADFLEAETLAHKAKLAEKKATGAIP